MATEPAATGSGRFSARGHSTEAAFLAQPRTTDSIPSSHRNDGAARAADSASPRIDGDAWVGLSLAVVNCMTQRELAKYFGACEPPQLLNDRFGDHQYDDADEEHAADQDYEDDADEDVRPPS